MTDEDHTGGKNPMSGPGSRKSRLSPLARLYVDHAANLAGRGQYIDVVQGVVRVAGRLASRTASRWKYRTERSFREAVAVQPTIDAKHNRMSAEGAVVEKLSFAFPSVTTPLLASIVIPCFNYGRYVGEAVESALGQTVQSLEIIVVDDGSTDPATHDVLAMLESSPRVQVVRQPNAGLPSARNTGISLAKGEYICCLDADDTIEPTYLELAIAVMEADRAVGFAYPWVWLFGDQTGVWQTQNFDIEEALIDNHTAVTAVFRRDDWLAAGGYRPDMRQGYEDWEFWLRLAALGRSGRVLPTPLFNHRRHGRTMTHDAHARRDRIIRHMRQSNPGIFGSSRLRRKIRRLHAVDTPADPFATLRAPGVLRRSDLLRPHLLIIAPWLGNGGAEILLLDILTDLRRDWRLTIVTTMPDQQPSWPKFRELTTDVVPLVTFADDAHQNLLDHLIVTRGSRVVLSHGSAFAYESFAGLKLRHPHLAVIDILHNDLPGGHIRNAVVASDDIDAHVAVSNTIAQSLVKHNVPSSRIATIPNGVDAENIFRPDRFERAAARDSLNLPLDRPVLAWVGRLSEEKRPLEFIEMVSNLSQRAPLTGIIVGDGALAPVVRSGIARAKKSGTDIRGVAHVERDDTPRLYAASDVVVLTSSIEGLPFVALEALACGSPVAATDVGDLRSLIRHGKTGFLAPADDLGSLADLIASVLWDEQALAEMRQQARSEFLRSKFTRENMLGAYRELLTRCLTKSARIAGQDGHCGHASG